MSIRASSPVVGRLDRLTAIRGAAALMVVLFHARGSWHPVFESGEGLSMIVANGWMWVHFFFVLSGFVMMTAYGDTFAERVTVAGWWRFIVIRFGRIYPLHVAMLAVMAIALAAGWMTVVDPPGSLAASLLLTQGFTYEPLVWNAPAWSISTEWFTYLAFPLAVPLLMRLRGPLLWTTWAVLAATVVAFFAPGASGDGEWPFGRLVLCVVEFGLGAATQRLVATHAWPRLPVAPATLAFVLPIMLMALPRPLDGAWLHAVVAVSFAIAIGVVATATTSVDRWLDSRPLQFLGAISYSLYLDHEILYSLAKTAANAGFGREQALRTLPTPTALALFAVYLAVLVVVSWATWRWIEEPMRTRFRGLAGRGARARVT